MGLVGVTDGMRLSLSASSLVNPSPHPVSEVTSPEVDAGSPRLGYGFPPDSGEGMGILQE